MRDELVYDRHVSTVSAWRDYSVEHAAFALHRITGWLLLAWVAVHLAWPAAARAPAAVYVPSATAEVVFLLAVGVFHAFNGLRLLAAELTGAGAGEAKRAFGATLALAALLVAVMGVGL